MSIVFTSLCSLTIFILFCRFFLTIVTVRGPSMEPTLVTGDRVLVVRRWPQRWLSTGRIVVAESPDNIGERLHIRSANKLAGEKTEWVIKRLVGLPSDTVYIPRATLENMPQEMISENVQVQPDDASNLIWMIPESHCFLRGDGTVSIDSRFWGPIPQNFIRGVVIGKLPRRAETCRDIE